MRIMPNQLENRLKDVQQSIVMIDKRIAKHEHTIIELQNFKQELIQEQERLLKEAHV